MNNHKAISIIVPIYRDAKTIGGTIAEILRFFETEKISGELIVVNDGGTDGGVAVVEAAMRDHPEVALINRGYNKGKGYTVRDGIAAATGDFIFYTDADLPFALPLVGVMLGVMRSGLADLVIVNRNLSGAMGNKRAPLLRRIAHRVYSLFVRALLFNFSDTLAGLKGMTRAAALRIVPHLTIDRFSFDVELLLVATRLGLKIKEIPAVLKNAGVSNLSVAVDSPQMVKDVLRIIIRDKLGYYKVKSKL